MTTPIKPMNAEEILKELHNMPFSVPVGEGSFQGLKCPNDGTEQFICKEEVRGFVRFALASHLAYVKEKMKRANEHYHLDILQSEIDELTK